MSMQCCCPYRLLSSHPSTPLQELRPSSLDLRSGYFQCSLTPEARPKTAFCTSRGLWQIRILPFGLCNAPATIERLVEYSLASPGSSVSSTRTTYWHTTALASLHRVLKRVAASGLKLHPNTLLQIYPVCMYSTALFRGPFFKLILHFSVSSLSGWPLSDLHGP